MTPDLVVIPHTHWDREWYLPFQRFRIGLVRMLDDVLDALAADPAYRFTMDGQLAAIEDYLEVRPSRRADVERFTAEGRLAIGPWLVLADSFLCSGETLIRNLELGLRGADALGGAMRIGYLPDQFGHAAQLPQIMRAAGITQACLWRGVPETLGRVRFRWVGADGSHVDTQYLPGGYGNAAGLLSGPLDGLDDRAEALVTAMRPWCPEGAVLGMYGADHSAPSSDITRLPVATLDVLRDAPEATETLEGELRRHGPANLLPGVVSARIPLKQAMARAERVLTRYAEPLAALWHPPYEAIDRLLEHAWRGVVTSSGHDSITGCGSDETAAQVAARVADAEQTSQAVADLVSARLAAGAPRGSIVVVNPSPFERTGLVLADLPARRAVLGVPVQRLEYAPELIDETVMDDLTQLLGRVHERELFGHQIVSWAVGYRVFTITVSRFAESAYAYEELRNAVLAAGPGPWRVRTLAEPVVTVAAQVTVPPLGRVTLTSSGISRPVAAARSAGRTLDNGLLRVTIDDDGTLTLISADGVTVTGAGRLAHGGDHGDTYNYAPPSVDAHDDAPRITDIVEIHLGPLVSAIDITRDYFWGLTSTRIELRAGEPFLRCAVTVDARCPDHRVRWHSPLPRAADHSDAEGQLAVVRRPSQPSETTSASGERPMGTYPAECFVTAGGLATLLTHVTEYEVLPTQEIALTLVRSVGYLSRNHNAYRDEPAGPEIPTPAAQCPGPVTTRFALLPHSGAWADAALPQIAERYRLDLLAFPGTGAPSEDLGSPGAGVSEAGVSLQGDGVVMTALRARDGWLEMRIVAEHPAPVEAEISGRFTEARRATLLGDPAGPLEVREGTARLTLRPFEIATVHLR
ncbi:alpha-mannosidase [Streptosporangiaceae bacterium NEAU-GS5]|nr:alpha-mannosidase [Streptosporangiaceae bacterium NEAU-GS5]